MRGLVGKGREGFGTGLIRHALAHPSDGRADCLRFAHPAEATLGFEGGRLCGREGKMSREVKNFVSL